MADHKKLRERDPNEPAATQGLFKKFEVKRLDGSDDPGGKHHGCEYFVLDIDHDPYARAALLAYANACCTAYPKLAHDLRRRYGLSCTHFDAAILDARRYQELRTGRRCSIINGIGDELRAEALDSFLDTILQQKQTCTRCGGEMKPGQAIESTLVGEPDDIGGCVTVSPGGPGKLVPCMKCSECGWSVTVGESK